MQFEFRPVAREAMGDERLESLARRVIAVVEHESRPARDDEHAIEAGEAREGAVLLDRGLRRTLAPNFSRGAVRPSRVGVTASAS